MNHPELLHKLSVLQATFWPTVVSGVAEATGVTLQMNSPLVLECAAGEAAQEFSAPAVLVRFAFVGLRESAQTLVLPLDTASALYTAFVEEDGLTEETVDALATPLGAVVQGLCVGIGTTREEIVAATDVSVKLGRFTRPPSMQPTDPLVRIQVAVGVDSTIGSLTWLIDPATAHFVANLAPPAEPQAAAPFNPLPPFGASRGGSDSPPGLDILMDVPLDITVELGRTRMMVKEVVDLGVGSIVEIEKAAGEPVDILVNGRIVAHGEVVVIEDNFGVRITEILNPRERVARLAA